MSLNLSAAGKGAAGKAAEKKAQTMAKEVIVVSGLPRSGTSLIMQMLQAGGVPLLTDHIRCADNSNPRGYFEYEPVRFLKKDASWLAGARGSAVKIVSPLLKYIPYPCPCKIIVMNRPLTEVLLSQTRMLLQQAVHKGIETASALLEQTAAENEALRPLYAKHMKELQLQPSLRSDFSFLSLDYHDVLKDPEEASEAITSFLGDDLDIAAMAAVVDPGLYRCRLDGD